MEYLECLESCFFEGGDRCFTIGRRYEIMSGSIHDIDGATLTDDQGTDHTVSGPWARRFRPVATGLAELIAQAEKIIESERVDEDLLWDKPKEAMWTIADEYAVSPPINLMPNVRHTRWTADILPADDES